MLNRGGGALANDVGGLVFHRSRVRVRVRVRARQCLEVFPLKLAKNPSSGRLGTTLRVYKRGRVKRACYFSKGIRIYS